MLKGMLCATICPAVSLYLAQDNNPSGRKISQAFCGWGDMSLAGHFATFMAVWIASDFYEFSYHRLGMQLMTSQNYFLEISTLVIHKYHFSFLKNLWLEEINLDLCVSDTDVSWSLRNSNKKWRPILHFYRVQKLIKKNFHSKKNEWKKLKEDLMKNLSKKINVLSLTFWS